MRLNSVKILKINITCDSRQKILEEIRKYLKEKAKGKRQKAKVVPKPVIIATPNPEQIVYARRNPYFADILNQADVAIPDGIGIVLASRLLQNLQPTTYNLQLLQRIPGVEFMEDLVRMSAKEGVGIALIGGRGNLAVEALERLQLKYPGLRGWAQEGPEVKIESTNLQIDKSTNDRKDNSRPMINLAIEQAGKDITDVYFDRFARKIKETKVQMIFVGLGAPKQEYFIEKLTTYNLQPTTPVALMSVGGAFEMITGKVRRAPLLIRLIGFEWLWRLICEPWRWRRQLALVEFIWLVFKEKFKVDRK